MLFKFQPHNTHPIWGVCCDNLKKKTDRVIVALHYTFILLYTQDPPCFVLLYLFYYSHIICEATTQNFIKMVTFSKNVKIGSNFYGTVIFFMTFLSRITLEIVTSTSCAASDENIIKMIIPFQCFKFTKM